MGSEFAPSYSVPTWFALRIAEVESSYNPNRSHPDGNISLYYESLKGTEVDVSGNCAVLKKQETLGLGGSINWAGDA